MPSRVVLDDVNPRSTYLIFTTDSNVLVFEKTGWADCEATPTGHAGAWKIPMVADCAQSPVGRHASRLETPPYPSIDRIDSTRTDFGISIDPSL